VTVEGMPPIDLSREMHRPALTYDPARHGYPVWLFSDLKRHDMGTANAAQHVQRGVALNEYLTPRLWGVADSAPYLHDGRAPSFDYAIAGHDGEGAAARAAFAALPLNDKGPLRVYLMSLRGVPRVVGGWALGRRSTYKSKGVDLEGRRRRHLGAGDAGFFTDSSRPS